MLELFLEYENCKTNQAKFIKDIDRADAVLLSKYYDNHKRSSSLLTPKFLAYAEKKHFGGYDNDYVSHIYSELRKGENKRKEKISDMVTVLSETCVNRS